MELYNKLYVIWGYLFHQLRLLSLPMTNISFITRFVVLLNVN
ncbi:hypothetical protein D9_0133 [Aeromonas phage D9]|nr:hypothetical protein D9_0133 [Aeromonas phage D9]